MKAMDGEEAIDQNQKSFLKIALPMFAMEGVRLFHEGKVCVTRLSVAKILELAQDSNIYGHFIFSKTILRLDNYHWRQKGRDLKRYIEGCLILNKRRITVGRNFWIQVPRKFRPDDGYLLGLTS